MQKILNNKFVHLPGLKRQLFLILGTVKVVILPSPTQSEGHRAAKYISEKDAPILASALKHSDYLLTLDNEFFKPKILEMARPKSLKILKPKEFIESFRMNY